MTSEENVELQIEKTNKPKPGKPSVVKKKPSDKKVTISEVVITEPDLDLTMPTFGTSPIISPLLLPTGISPISKVGKKTKSQQDLENPLLFSASPIKSPKQKATTKDNKKKKKKTKFSKLQQDLGNPMLFSPSPIKSPKREATTKDDKKKKKSKKKLLSRLEPWKIMIKKNFPNTILNWCMIIYASIMVVSVFHGPFWIIFLYFVIQFGVAAITNTLLGITSGIWCAGLGYTIGYMLRNFKTSTRKLKHFFYSFLAVAVIAMVLNYLVFPYVFNEEEQEWLYVKVTTYEAISNYISVLGGIISFYFVQWIQ